MGYTWPLVALLLAASYLYFRGDSFDPESLRNKRVIVTGASSGIGEQLAYQYARLGAKLVITARRAQELRKVADHCKSLGAAQIEIVAADMKDADDRNRVVQATEKLLGGLDVLILNHAKFTHAWWLGNPKNMIDLEHDMEVNFGSYVDVASRAMPLLVASKGHLGVVSSGYGKMGCPLLSQYSAAKFALHGFFSSWRQELNVRQSGVSITMCVLGLINTENVMDLIRENLPDMDSSVAAPADDCARAIVEGVASRTTEMIYPKIIYYAGLLYKVFPDLVEYYNAEHVLHGEVRGMDIQNK